MRSMNAGSQYKREHILESSDERLKTCFDTYINIWKNAIRSLNCWCKGNTVNSDVVTNEVPPGTANRGQSTEATPLQNSNCVNVASTTTPVVSHHLDYTLPDGRIMDAKNTLQSFDVAPRSLRVPIVVSDDPTSTTNTLYVSNSTKNSARATNPSSRPPFTLPDGRIMDSKNTLQSFVVPNPARYDVDARHEKRNIDYHIQLSPQQHSVHDTLEENIVPVEAVAVRSMAVTIEAEPYVEPERRESSMTITTIQKGTPRQTTKQGLSKFVIVAIMIIVGVGIFVGTYCGTGRCSPAQGQNASQSLRSSNTTDQVATLPPSTKSVDSLMVACHFLSISDLSECQATTSFHGSTVGDTIPSEIGLLTQLQMLDLYQQQLVGTIPSTMGNLIHLTALYLYVNQLTGTIPSTLGNLVLLTGLYFAQNQLSGSIPSTFGNLIELNYLYLYNNQLTGTLPASLKNLVKVQDMSLSSNSFRGTLLTSILEKLSNLQIFVIDNNQFTGTIPSLLGSMTHLTYLGMASNELVGTIPSTFSNLVQLTQLDLYGNVELDGTVPMTLCSVADVKIGIDCNGNILCSCCYERLTSSFCP